MRYKPSNVWIQHRSPSLEARKIHTLRQIDLHSSRSDNSSVSDLAISLSLNINNRKSGTGHQEYSQSCLKYDLPQLIKPFQTAESRTHLCMLIAESTLFIQNHATKKIKVRGGHISACELIIPALTDSSSIIVDKVISKLPGEAPAKPSSARTVSGKALERQNYQVVAKYETSDNFLLFRDSNSPIDSNSNFATPLFIALIDYKKVGLDYNQMYENAVRFAKTDKIYKRMGGACGEFVVKSYFNQLPPGFLTGMATQMAFDLVLMDIASKTDDKNLADSLYQARQKICFNLDPIQMHNYGVDIVRQYRNSPQDDNGKTLKNSTGHDSIDPDTSSTPTIGGKRS